jgi:hypothetical protein
VTRHDAEEKRGGEREKREEEEEQAELVVFEEVTRTEGGWTSSRRCDTRLRAAEGTCN